nr:serine hydrolase domain-containing protein [Altererythrobacter lutimaris]
MLCAAIVALSPARAATPDWAAVDALVAPYEGSDRPGISVAVMIDGEVVYERYAGMADLSHEVPISSHTRFNIASITKQFTAFAIMLLADEGKLALDQDVRDFIPELHERATPVTIRHMLDHTSGLREVNSLLLLTGANEATPVTQARSLDLILRQRGENFPAGQRREYSNTGYILLAEIVERVSGQPFPDFMQERVFKPLGMDRTFVNSDSERITAGLASSYQPRGDGFARSNLLNSDYGASGIISSPRDMLLWANALETGMIGNAAVRNAFDARSTLADGSNAIGANGQEYRKFRGVDTWSHGGTSGGYRSFLLRIPDEKMAIAVMGNRSDFLKAAFAFDVAGALLADRLEPEPSTEFAPETHEELDRYVGDYRLFAGIEFSVRREGDNLTVALFGTDGGFVMEQVGRGEFMFDPARDLRFVFRDFENGRASQMRWTVSADGYIPAPRVDMVPVPSGPIDTAGIAGVYYSDTLQHAIEIQVKENALWVRTGDALYAQLDRYQPDTFRPIGQSPIQRLEFTRADGGAVAGVLVSTSLADNIEYRRIK